MVNNHMMNMDHKKKVYTQTLQKLGLISLRGRNWKHVTPRYIIDRIGVHLYQRQHPDCPWLTRQVVEILEDWIQPLDVGHEWGSGRSTVWFARRIKELTSVEHHPQWGDIVQKMLLEERVADKISYNLIEQNNYLASDDYVNVVNNHSDESLDFCLVDGILRDRCALSALSKIKPGGILIIDNVNWFMPHVRGSSSPNSRRVEDGCASELWKEVYSVLSSWRCIWTSNGVTDTAFWVKPLG